MKSLFTTAALVALIALPGLARPADLPQLGSSADSVLAPHEADLIGASMLHQMRAEDIVLDDPLMHSWINDFGYRLLAHTEFPKDLHFTFFVVRDNTINAFAAPGGYIGVNTGLITATRNESELAGVLAHEIAHVTQQHIQRAVEDARKMAPLAGLAMIGAILASQGSSGDAAPAILAGGMGAIAQRQINFTRKDEAEADRIGIETLARAGFDVNGMAGFFSRMEQLLRPGSGGVEPPELLLTHPVTSRRISEARARARLLEEKYRNRSPALLGQDVAWEQTTAPIPWVPDSRPLYQPDTARNADTFTYELMHERARVLAAARRTTILQYYADGLRGDPDFDSAANRYGYALALVQNNRATEAITELEPLLAAHPDNTALRLALADARLHAGQRGAALALYAELKEQMPRHHAVTEAYASALLRSGKPEDAAHAAALLRPLLDDEVNEPQLYRTYGRACELSGQTIRAAEAFADATWLSGRATDALEQLKRLLRNKDLDYYQRARIQARIDYITPIVYELHRRGIGAERQGMG